jgi:hypothetical protein
LGLLVVAAVAPRPPRRPLRVTAVLSPRRILTARIAPRWYLARYAL